MTSLMRGVEEEPPAVETEAGTATEMPEENTKAGIEGDEELLMLVPTLWGPEERELAKRLGEETEAKDGVPGDAVAAERVPMEAGADKG